MRMRPTRILNADTPKKNPCIRAIRVLLRGGEEERAGGLSVGCDNFLRKPFREADIFAIMNKYMGVL